MSQQTSPFLEGKYGWEFGEDGWNTGMDENLLKFSYMLDRNIDGVVASLPAVSNGTAYFLTTDSRVYYSVGGTYYSSPVPKWSFLTIKSTGESFQFDGSTLVSVPSNSNLNTRLASVETVVDNLGSAAFEDISTFATQAALDSVSAQANNYTDTLRNDIASESDSVKGSTLVGWLRNVTGAVGAKLSAFLSWGDVHAFEFLTVSEIIAVRAGTAGDMRAKLQLALDASVGKTLRINEGLWQMTPLSQDNPTVGLCLDVPSNIRVVFDAGAKIELTAHNHTIYQMFRIWDRDNVVIERATLSGRRDLNAAVSGEFGMCIDIRGGSNIHLIDPETDDAWGDGIYVGQTNTAESVNGLTIDNHRANNNRRQGGSLVSARNFTLNLGLAGDTAGTAPSAGWDIEPNNNSAVLEGIKFIGLNTYNNAGSGLVIELGQFAGDVEKTIDIEVIGHTDDGSTVGVSINGLKNTGTVKGSINISGTWKNNQNQGVVSADYSGEGPSISVNGAVINCNRSGQASAKYGSALVVLRDTTSATSYPIGNIDFEGMTIESTSGTVLKPFYFDDTLNPNTNVINVHFRNPKKLSGLTSNSGGFFGLGTISNGLNNWSEKLTGSTTISANLYAPLEFADASSNISITTAGAFVRGAPDIIIKKPNNSNTHDIIVPAGAFIGLGGTITRLRSVVGDSYVRLRPMGGDKFAIIERVGLWTEVV